MVRRAAIGGVGPRISLIYPAFGKDWDNVKTSFFWFGLKFDIRDGCCTSFWNDKLCSWTPLAIRFLKVFSIDVNKEGSISEFGLDNRWRIPTWRCYSLDSSTQKLALLEAIKEVVVSFRGGCSKVEMECDRRVHC